MTPDELPADMEAVIARLSDPHLDIGFDHEGDLAGHLVDREDLRALLKAYQKQRRALERIASAEVDGLDLERDSMVLTRAIKLARAAPQPER